MTSEKKDRVIKPFSKQSEFTMINNYVLDHIMPELSPNSWKCLCFIIRKTIGWHKQSDRLSFSQIRAGTGIKSDPTVVKALEQLEDKSLIVVCRNSNQFESNTYTLNLALEITVEPTEPTIETIVEPTIETIVEPTIETIVEPTIETIVEPTIETIVTKERINKDLNKVKESARAPEKILEKHKGLAFALIVLCGYKDPKFVINGKLKICAEAVAQLIEWGATPADLDKFSQYWWGNSPPTFGQVVDEWGKFLAWLKKPNGAHNDKRSKTARHNNSSGHPVSRATGLGEWTAEDIEFFRQAGVPLPDHGQGDGELPGGDVAAPG